jgi:cation transport ATPase
MIGATVNGTGMAMSLSSVSVVSNALRLGRGGRY